MLCRRMRVLLAVAITTLGAPAGGLAQSPPASLIAEARRQIDALDVDSASALLVQALDPRVGATRPERVRALVLLAAVEVIAGRIDRARRAFREALTLDPDLRVDTLASLHTYLLTAFEAERAASPVARPSVALPESARVRAMPPMPRVSETQLPNEARGGAPEGPGGAGGFELSVLAAVTHLDQQLSSRTRSEAYGGASVRLGYVFDSHVNVTAAVTYGPGHRGTLLWPSLSVAYALDLERKHSPYVLAGVGATRIRTDAWGDLSSGVGWHVGLGWRSTLSRTVALRLEFRLIREPFVLSSYYTENVMVWNSMASVGLSFLLGSGWRARRVGSRRRRGAHGKPRAAGRSAGARLPALRLT